MDDINKFSDDNIGGVLLCRFIPVENVSEIPSPINYSINTAVVLKSNCRWFDIYGTQGTKEFTEESTQSDAGTSFKKSIKLITPKIRTELDDQFNDMANRLFILDVTDNNGLRKIVGTIDEPLKFKCTATTKADVAQRNEYSIEFFGEGTQKSYTYNL